MTTDKERLERQIELVKSHYPDRDSIWAFFDTLKSNAFILSCMKNSRLDKKVREYIGDKVVSTDEWLYIWDVFAIIEYASTTTHDAEEKYREFEKQFNTL